MCAREPVSAVFPLAATVVCAACASVWLRLFSFLISHSRGAPASAGRALSSNGRAARDISSKPGRDTTPTKQGLYPGPSHHIRVNQTLGEQKVSFRSGRSGQSEAQSRKMRANSRRAGGSLCLAGASWPPSLPSQRKHLIRQLGLRCVLFTQEGKVSLEVVYQLYGFDICKRLQECHVHRQSPVSSSGLLNISACRQ